MICWLLNDIEGNGAGVSVQSRFVVTGCGEHIRA